MRPASCFGVRPPAATHCASASACARVIVFSGLSFLSFPDALIGVAAARRPRGKNDEIEDRPPEQFRRLDHARIGQKLLEIAAHRPKIGRLGRSEIDEKNPDALLGAGIRWLIRHNLSLEFGIVFGIVQCVGIGYIGFASARQSLVEP